MTGLTVFLYIIFYSFIGWVAEVLYWFIQEGYFINRGFLTAPICPMYGIGAIITVKLLGKYKESIKIVFCAGVVLAAIMEQTTSYILERAFNLVLWDYSYSRWDINGRLSAKNLMLFGIFSVALIKIIHPGAVRISEKISRKASKIFVFVIILCLSLDILVTTITVTKANLSKELNKEAPIDIHQLVPARKKVVREFLDDIGLL